MEKIEQRLRRITTIALSLFLMTMSASVVIGDGSDPLDPSDGGADWDGDGLTNAEEQSQGTDMNNADTDNDGLPDGWEANYGLNPLSASDSSADPDGDGINAIRLEGDNILVVNDSGDFNYAISNQLSVKMRVSDSQFNVTRIVMIDLLGNVSIKLLSQGNELDGSSTIFEFNKALVHK